MATDPEIPAAECKRARLAYLLYLANLSFLPVISFILILFFWRGSAAMSPFVHSHYQQATLASIIAGVLLAMVSGVIVLAGGFHSPWTWVILILYFTLCHTLLLLLGVFGFTRANNGKAFEFFNIRSWRI